MKAFLAAVATMVVIAAVAPMALEQAGFSADGSTSSSVRLD
ncbi:hypothetical protein [Ruegeria sediminis]|nr:hypothetical protein [Ruegeria sediminis]